MDVRVDRVDPLDGRELLAHRNFVRSLARQLVRDAATADDVAQETMARMLEAGRPGSIRPWLRSVARNLARRFGRREKRRAEVEGGRAQWRKADERIVAPATDEIAARLELQRRLTERVLALEPRARDVVILHFYEGKTVAEVAEQLGIPLETARTRLRRALAELRAGWNGELGGEREGLAALALLARWPPAKGLVAAAGAAAATPLFWTGVVAMTSKVKVAVAAVVVALAAGAIALWPESGIPGEPRPRKPAEVAPLAEPATAQGLAPPAAATAAAPKREEEGPRAAVSESRGTLELRVHYARDHSAAADVTINVRKAGSDFRIGVRRARTDANGVARFEKLPAGRFRVQSDRAEFGMWTFVRADETTAVDVEIPVGLDVTGIVVDPDGEPVPDAIVEIAPLARADFDAQPLATTDEEGRFDVRDAPAMCLVGARAPGFSASRMTFLTGKEGNATEVRLELGAAGGSVDGVVVGPDEKPVPATLLRIGPGSTSGIFARQNGAPPLPAFVQSDEQGRFHAVGIKAGRHPVVAHAPGFAPFHGECDVVADGTTALHVVLGSGATVRGVVRDGSGKPVGSAEVDVGQWEDLTHQRVFTTAEGFFELAGLAAGEIEISTSHDDFGKASRRIVAVAGETVECDFGLSRGLELKGRVVDAEGAPVADAIVEGIADDWFADAPTDREGRFTIPNCPERRTVALAVHVKGFAELRRNGVDPKAGEVELLLDRRSMATARIVGRVVDPNGRPVANAQISALATTPSPTNPFWATGMDGSFDIGPFPAGGWRLLVRCVEFPSFWAEPHELKDGEKWDAGTIQLRVGGSAIFQIEGDHEGVNFFVLDAAEVDHSCLEVTSDRTRMRSISLLPGDYRLMITGERIAARTIPFTIREGAETSAVVRLEPGIRQVVEIAFPKELDLQGGARIRVFRGDDPVLRWMLSIQEDRTATGTFWLAPGEYTLTVSAPGHEGRATFTVGGDERPPVRVEVK